MSLPSWLQETASERLPAEVRHRILSVSQSSFSRYENASCTASHLYTHSRMFQRQWDSLVRNILSMSSTGLGIDFITRVRCDTLLPFSLISSVCQVTEWQTKTGFPHIHSVGFVNIEDNLRSIQDRLISHDETLTTHDIAPLLDLAANSVSVSLSADELATSFPCLGRRLAEEVATLAGRFQIHRRCGSDCQREVESETETCRLFYPQLPTFFHIIASCPALSTPQDEKALEQVESLHAAVKSEMRKRREAGTLEADDSPHGLALLLLVAAGCPKMTQADQLEWHGIQFPRDEQFYDFYSKCRALVPQPSVEHAELLAIYHRSLLARRQAKHLPRRTLSAAYVEEYNPWMLRAACGNVSVKMVLHTPDKLYRYITKSADGSQGIRAATSELRRRGGQLNLARCDLLEAKTADGYREVTLGQALHRLDPTLRLSKSDLSVVWLCADVPELRGDVSFRFFEWYRTR